MKRFAAQQASAFARRHGAAVAVLQRDATASPRAKSAPTSRALQGALSATTPAMPAAALWASHACYSSHTSKAVSNAKAAKLPAATTTVPVAGSSSATGGTTATTPLTAPAATASTGSNLKDTRSMSSRLKGGGPRPAGSLGDAPAAGGGVTEPPTQAPMEQHTQSRRRRSSSFGLSNTHVKPMRGRQSSEPPRKRRTKQQKATVLVRSHRETADASFAAGAAADTAAAISSPFPPPTLLAEVQVADTRQRDTEPEERVLVAKSMKSTEADVTDIDEGIVATPSSPPGTTPNTTEMASLSTAQLLCRVQLASFLERAMTQLQKWAASLKEWTHPSSDSTLREWERQLLLALRHESFADCTLLQSAMQQRYEDQFGSSSHDVAFLTLYARVLMNNAVFCLTNFVTYRATQLLTLALTVAQRAYTLKDQQGQAGLSLTAPAEKKRKKTRSTSTSTASPPPHSVTGDPESYLAFLRVLLANAYASDQQYWKAAEQYQLALAALERNPLWSPDQLAPGPASPLALSHTFVEEDAKLFYADATRVDQAVAQGTAQLFLLQSQGAVSTPTRVMHAQLAMARLHRHAGRYTESQSFYESYLDGATEHMEGEDVSGVMLELGRLLLYKVRNEDVSLVYLEAAANMLLEDAKELLERVAASSTSSSSSVLSDATLATTASTTDLRIIAGCAAQRAAGALVDTAMAFHAQGKTGKAVGLMEGCLELLDRADLRLVSGWVREQYADMLATVSLVDRALEEYSRAIELLRTDRAEVVEQLGAGGLLVHLSAAEVEGHLAFCLQTYVGDHKRAMTHYRNVMDGAYHRTHSAPSVTSAQGKLSKRARRQRAAAATACVAAHDVESPAPAKGRSRLSSVNGGSAVAPSIDFALRPDVLHWVLSNYVACCERVSAYAEATGVQNRLIEIEGALGGNVVDSYLKLIALQRQAGEVEKTLALCFYVFYLPDSMLPPHTRLEVASCFASSCHQLGNNRMGAVLLQAVQQVRGDHDANSLVQYALCLKGLDPTDRLQLDGMMDIEAGMSAIGRIFRRAASIVITDSVLDGAGDAEEEGFGHNVRTEARMTDSQASWSQVRLERALNALVVLSRGAFFFHQNRFLKDAADLYTHALQHVDHLAATMPTLPEEFQREMGILLVNYATLQAAKDPAAAATLYERAAAVCPTYMEVAGVVADFFVQSGDYAKGSVYMHRVLQANPAAAEEMHLRLARLGTGPAWEAMTYSERMQVLEHLLKGLGISSERIAAAFALAAQRQLASDAPTLRMGLTDVAHLLTDGVATTMSEDAVCLATYVVQTRFQEPQLLNRMYRRALLRFPQHATILVNYATLCMYSGFHVLARKYIAKAYAASSADLNCTMCYAHYLCRSFEEQQIGSGESLYRFFLNTHPNSAQGHAAFANFMAGVMPTPFETESHFKRALALAPNSEDVVLQYGQFMWACTDSKTVYTNSDVRRRIFDRAEQLFKEAVALNPQSFTACHQLGTFYANRHNRFEEAMKMLYKAHKLQPSNVEVLRHLLGALQEECGRVQREEQRQRGTVAGQGSVYDGASPPSSSRLRSLTDATKDMFESVLGKEPNDRATLERYARFAVETLKDPSLAASLYRRIQELSRK